MFDPNLAVVFVLLIIVGLASAFCCFFWMLFKFFDKETNEKKEKIEVQKN